MHQILEPSPELLLVDGEQLDHSAIPFFAKRFNQNFVYKDKSMNDDHNMAK
jgi:hypothetical protein